MPFEPMVGGVARGDDTDIPKGRIRRTAQVGSVVGSQGARYAGTRARNLARDPEQAAQALDQRHLEAAEQMVETLGRMKGAAMKIGQLASFIDTEFLPPEYRDLYQDKLATLRSTAPPMPWKKVRSVLDEEWDEPVEELFEDFEHEAAAAASIGQVHRAVLPDGRQVAVKVQYPGVASAIAADMQNAGLILRLAKAFAPGLDAKAAAAELKERVMEELDYELEAQSQRAFARGYRRHPFIYVPDVVTRLSTERVLVSEWVDGAGFDEVRELPQPEKDRFGEIVFRFCFGSIYHLQHFNADAHPGNYLVVSGRPTPTRTRAKSPLPSPRLSDFSPLWPASPPPVRTSIFPNGRSISSWIATTWSRSTPSAPRAGPTELPDSFMYVCGSRTATRFPSA